MTKNQIDYWNYRETKRHNEVTEQEAERANKVRESETERANRAKEAATVEANAINKAFNEARNQETYRHNYQTELAQVQSLENERAKTTYSYYSSDVARQIANINAGVGYAQVGLGYNQLEETKRHQQQQDFVSWANAETNSVNAKTNRMQLGATARKQQLEETKWNQGGRNQSIAQTALMNAQTKTQYVSQQRMQHQNTTDTVNAGANLLGAASRLIKIGGSK